MSESSEPSTREQLARWPLYGRLAVFVIGVPVMFFWILGASIKTAFKEFCFEWKYTWRDLWKLLIGKHD